MGRDPDLQNTREMMRFSAKGHIRRKSEEEKAEFKELCAKLFHKVDTNGDQQVCAKELQAAALQSLLPLRVASAMEERWRMEGNDMEDYVNTVSLGVEETIKLFGGLSSRSDGDHTLNLKDFELCMAQLSTMDELRKVNLQRFAFSHQSKIS